MSEKILNDRQKTHGDYFDVAIFSQDLKSFMRSHPKWGGLLSIQKESLEMIAMKISRILNGNQNEVDHWDDISGYALLISRELKK